MLYVAAGIITRIQQTLVIFVDLAILLIANDIRENHTNHHIHGASDKVNTRFVDERR